MTAIAPATRTLARRLRAAMTPQERRRWWHLRELNRMLGTNFRRQAPVGRFVVDFAHLGRRLVIEVDGGKHGAEAGLARDVVRDDWLAGQGFAVLRVWNNEVSGNIEGVMQTVLDALGIDGGTPPPHPSGQCPDPTRGVGGIRTGALRARAVACGFPSPRGGRSMSSTMGVGGTAAGRETTP